MTIGFLSTSVFAAVSVASISDLSSENTSEIILPFTFGWTLFASWIPLISSSAALESAPVTGSSTPICIVVSGSCLSINAALKLSHVVHPHRTIIITASSAITIVALNLFIRFTSLRIHSYYTYCDPKGKGLIAETSALPQ